VSGWLVTGRALFSGACLPDPVASLKDFLMPSRRSSKKDSPKKLAGRIRRRWRVVLLRNKGEILGQVEASDAQAAKAAAAAQFELDDIQRNRIIVQELG
jgi:hypothetical protein